MNNKAIIQSCEMLNAAEASENNVFCSSMSGLKEIHHYNNNGNDSTSNTHSLSTMKSIMREIKNSLLLNLTCDPRGCIFLRFDEDSPQYMRAMLTGMEGSPYSSGVFLFDIFCPPEYPTQPCQVTHITPGADTLNAPHSPGGFSPNLHADGGKVCLSLLGTWEGPGWQEGVSNIYQVLSSILLMILAAENPYFMVSQRRSNILLYFIVFY